MADRMPAVFMGHGSPMLALEDNDRTRALTRLGERIVERHGRPKAALMVSAHWFTPGWLVQTEEEPEQVYDMYGFPQELYDFKYPVKGSPELGRRVLELAGEGFAVEEDVERSWGIDHGAWTTLCHLFPKADVPVVQLSVSRAAGLAESYEAGRRLAALRDEGYLLLASGNVVHNLYRVNWDMPEEGYDWARGFDGAVRDLVLARDDECLLHADELPDYKKAAPTLEHFLPLEYVLGATEGEVPEVLNDVCDLGAVSMTSYAFGV